MAIPAKQMIHAGLSIVKIDFLVQFGLDGSIVCLPWSAPAACPAMPWRGRSLSLSRPHSGLEHLGAVRYFPDGAEPDAVRERRRDQPDRKRGASLHHRGNPAGGRGPGAAAPASRLWLDGWAPG